MKQIIAVLTVVAVIVLFWYGSCIPMNIKGVLTELERGVAEVQPPTASARRDMGEFGLVLNNGFAIPATWEQKKPRLPSPHQVAVELWETTAGKKITSKRSLIYHGWVRGLECMELGRLGTYDACRSQGFWKLRLPASMPCLFASLKVGVAASLVGAIVGEWPTGAVAGLGARLLAGSDYGQTVQIWSALFAAAILAACLVGLLGLIERQVLGRMGMAQ